MSWRDKIAAVLAGKVGGPTPTGIHAYHSSPHDFDKFDLAKIGTGEGAQTYGHGIYAAENPAVSGQGGRYWSQFTRKFMPDEQSAAKLLQQHEFDRAKAAADAQKHIDTMQRYIRDPANAQDALLPAYERGLPAYQRQLELLQSNAPIGTRTYEVNFRAKPEELLDWDKRLTEQPAIVQDFARRADLSHLKEGNRSRVLVEKYRAGAEQPEYPATGQAFYHSLMRDPYDKRPASAVLNEAGIPGIRYLDEGSRHWNKPQHHADIADFQAKLEQARKVGSPDDIARHERLLAQMQAPPTHNYVAFDPSKLDIMAKYGVVGATGGVLGAGAMGGTIDQSTYGAQQ